MSSDRDTARNPASYARRIIHWLLARPPEERVTWLDRFNSCICKAAMFLTAVAVIITFYEVVLRYIFGSPTLWVNEMTLWTGSIIFLMAGVYAMQRRSHIRITAVYDLMSPRVKLISDAVSTLVIVAYAAMMIVASYEIAWSTLMSWERFGTFWNPPIPATVKPLVLIATGLVALQAISNFFVDARNTLGASGGRSDKVEKDG
ncbi:MAG: TRAP transporter small permease [Rhodobacteraceae bacterium]|nr:TRAP transporter small permease [Paracoccaceae bacterium]